MLSEGYGSDLLINISSRLMNVQAVFDDDGDGGGGDGYDDDFL